MTIGRFTIHVTKVSLELARDSVLLTIQANSSPINIPIGYGKYVYPNSFFLYEGEWSMGRKHGELSSHPDYILNLNISSNVHV